MKTNYARRVSEQAFNELVEAVEAGKSQKLVDYLKAMGKFHNYSLGNAILIGFQKPDATHVAGFRTWKRLGRYVKKGEHGIVIMAPIIYRKKKELEETNDKETEHEVVTTFKTVHVFDINQTVFSFEANLDLIEGLTKDKRTFKELLKYPKVLRDFAFLFDKSVKYASVKDFIIKESGDILKSVKLFDLFESNEIGKDKKSMAFSLEYFDYRRTLTDEEVDKDFQSLINKVTKNFNAILRGK